MSLNDKNINMFNSLCNNFEYFVLEARDSNKKTVLFGAPDYQKLFIGMFFQLINDYPNLIEDQAIKLKLYNLVFRHALSVAKHSYYDYITDEPLHKDGIDDYIRNIWINTDLDSVQYYYGCGAYNSGMIHDIQLKKLIKQLMS